jgi:hypothetical protein
MISFLGSFVLPLFSHTMLALSLANDVIQSMAMAMAMAMARGRALVGTSVAGMFGDGHGSLVRGVSHPANAGAHIPQTTE